VTLSDDTALRRLTSIAASELPEELAKAKREAPKEASSTGLDSGDADDWEEVWIPESGLNGCRGILNIYWCWGAWRSTLWGDHLLDLRRMNSVTIYAGVARNKYNILPFIGRRIRREAYGCIFTRRICSVYVLVFLGFLLTLRMHSALYAMLEKVWAKHY
jgi:hypothetical protein